jgi:cytochrome c oxidase subunit 2
MFVAGSLFISPEIASTFALEVDLFYGFMWTLTIVISLGIVAAAAYFVTAYRRKHDDEVGAHIEGHLAMELTWTVIPLFICMFIFAWGASLFLNISRPPDDAMEMFVVGKRWMWKAQHMNGKREINTLHVPVGKPVKLTMTSEDVLHSFYIPAFRVKQDVVPGRYSSMWFEATKTGEFHLFCAEYCGTEHSRMIGTVVAMEPADYQNWLETSALSQATDPGLLSPLEHGRQLFAQHGCQTCHLDNGGGVGPQLAGIIGNEVLLAGGETAKVDDAYIRESILNPLAKVVHGYQPVMPTFTGRLSEEEMLALVTYIKSMGSEDASADAEPVADPDAAVLAAAE